jgi:hypothetical protein
VDDVSVLSKARSILSRRGTGFMGTLAKDWGEAVLGQTVQAVKGDEVTWTVKKRGNSVHRHRILAVLWDEASPEPGVGLEKKGSVNMDTEKGGHFSTGPGYTTVCVEEGTEVDDEPKEGQSISFTARDIKAAVPASAGGQEYVVATHLQGDFFHPGSGSDEEKHDFVYTVCPFFTLWKRQGEEWHVSHQLRWDYQAQALKPL